MAGAIEELNGLAGCVSSLWGVSWGRTSEAAAQDLRVLHGPPACLPVPSETEKGQARGQVLTVTGRQLAAVLQYCLVSITCFSTRFPCQARTLLRFGRNTVLPFKRSAFTCTAAQPVHRATKIRVISTQHCEGSAQEETKYSAPSL